MLVSELIATLQNLIKDEKITQEKIANIWGVTKATVNQRCNKDSEVTVSELLKVEEHYNVNLLPRRAPSFKFRKKPLNIDFSKWGLRFEEVPAANQMTLSRFSEATGIDYDRLCDFVHDHAKPTLDELCAIISVADVTFEFLACDNKAD